MNQHRSNQTIKNIIAIGLCAWATTVCALNSDRSQPIHISASTWTYDRENHIVTYAGNVQANQGTSHLDGDKVVVYTTADNKIKKMIAWGTPAHYNTIPTP